MAPSVASAPKFSAPLCGFFACVNMLYVAASKHHFSTGLRVPLYGWQLFKQNKNLRLWMGVSAGVYLVIGCALWFSMGLLTWSGAGIYEALLALLVGANKLGEAWRWLAPTESYTWSLLPKVLLLGLAALASALMATAAYSMYIISCLVLVPVHMWLAEHVLKHHKVLKAKKIQWVSWLYTSWRMFVISIKKMMFLFVLGLFVWIIKLFWAPLAFWMGFLIITFDLMDYHFELVEWSLKQRFVFFKKHWLCFSGQATILSLLSLIPVVGLVAIPFVIAGQGHTLKSGPLNSKKI